MIERDDAGSVNLSSAQDDGLGWAGHRELWSQEKLREKRESGRCL